MFRRLMVFVVAAVLGFALVGCVSESSGVVDPNAQNPECHRAALASASNRVPGFEWNEVGMDTYHSEYDACLKIAGL